MSSLLLGSRRRWVGELGLGWRSRHGRRRIAVLSRSCCLGQYQPFHLRFDHPDVFDGGPRNHQFGTYLQRQMLQEGLEFWLAVSYPNNEERLILTRIVRHVDCLFCSNTRISSQIALSLLK